MWTVRIIENGKINNELMFSTRIEAIKKIRELSINTEFSFVLVLEIGRDNIKEVIEEM